MPVPTTTLEQEFSSLSTDDVVVDKAAPAFVTPKKHRDPNSSLASDDDTCVSESFPVAPSPSTPDSVVADNVITKTEHKLKEERGELAPEPLLVTNPHRFVIFPIKDNDVSSFRIPCKYSNIAAIRINDGTTSLIASRIKTHQNSFLQSI